MQIAVVQRNKLSHGRPGWRQQVQPWLPADQVTAAAGEPLGQRLRKPRSEPLFLSTLYFLSILDSDCLILANEWNLYPLVLRQHLQRNNIDRLACLTDVPAFQKASLCNPLAYFLWPCRIPAWHSRYVCHKETQIPFPAGHVVAGLAGPPLAAVERDADAVVQRNKLSHGGPGWRQQVQPWLPPVQVTAAAGEPLGQRLRKPRSEPLFLSTLQLLSILDSHCLILMNEWNLYPPVLQQHCLGLLTDVPAS